MTTQPLTGFEAYGDDSAFFEAVRSHEAQKIQIAEAAKARAELDLVNEVLAAVSPDIERIGRETGAMLIKLFEVEQQETEAIR
jgi:hypothetical protein